MNTTDNGSEPARPVEGFERTDLRAWLVGQALSGLCANPGGPFQANGMNGWGLCNCKLSDVGDLCRDLADSTLAALGRGSEATEAGTEPAN